MKTAFIGLASGFLSFVVGLAGWYMEWYSFACTLFMCAYLLHAYGTKIIVGDATRMLQESTQNVNKAMKLIDYWRSRAK